MPLKQKYWDFIAKLDTAVSQQAFQQIAKDMSALPPEQVDPIQSFLLAEMCLSRGQTLAAAQVYVRMLVRQPLEILDEASFLVQFKAAMHAINVGDAAVTSMAEFVLFCFGRVAKSLGAGGIIGEDQDAWVSEALEAVYTHSPELKAQATANALLVVQHKGEIATEFQIERRRLHRRIHRLLGTAKSSKRNHKMPTKGMKRYLLASVFIAACLGLLIWGFWNDLNFKETRYLISDINIIARVLMVWSAGLILVWVLSLLGSVGDDTHTHVTPAHYINRKSAVFGQIVSFRNDTYFHVFQFVWIPFSLLSLLIFNELTNFVEHLQASWSAVALDQQAGYLETIRANQTIDLPAIDTWREWLRSLICNDLAMLALGGVVAFGTLIWQIHIQRRRQSSSVGLYWWDWRISKLQWMVRWLMMGVTMTIGFALMWKIAGLGVLSFFLTKGDLLQVHYFFPDGVGGLKFLADIFALISWVVFLLGLFAMVGVYMHRNMPEYRLSDLAMVSSFTVTACLIMSPFVLLELQLHSEFNRLFDELKLSGEVETGIPPMSELEALTALRHWRPSALRIGVFSGPVLPILSQIIFVVFQYVMRSNKNESLIADAVS